MLIKIVSLEELGKVLYEIRKKAKGMSQQELSEKAGLSALHISKLEKGHSIDMKELEAIAKAMDCRVAVAITMNKNDFFRLVGEKM